MFDRDALAAALAHGPVARVVVAEVRGSAPREPGAAMLVRADGQSGEWQSGEWQSGEWQSGTIGGGALEWEAAATARAMLRNPGATLPLVSRIPLGPALNQCCGGAVTLVTEVWTALPDAPVVARSLDGSPMPLAVARLLDRARAQGDLPGIRMIQGWLVEPVLRPRRQIWIWGAGHVGRAIVATMAPLPDIALIWADVAADRFPGTIPEGTRRIARHDLPQAVAEAPRDAHHLILTFSHTLDLEICHRLLGHGFASLGLIGSATKAARFRARLAALGHAPASIARIRCPIGDPSLGKHPQAIAIGVAAAFLAAPRAAERTATA